MMLVGPAGIAMCTIENEAWGVILSDENGGKVGPFIAILDVGRIRDLVRWKVKVDKWTN